MKADDIITVKREISTAILVDGGFYRKRAYYFWGEKSPKERADELYDYCMKLLHNQHEQRYLYRIFYYDCPPVEKNVYNPLTKRSVDLAKSDEYKWTNEFFKELKSKRKVALRMGRLSENSLHYNIKPEAFKKLVNGLNGFLVQHINALFFKNFIQKQFTQLAGQLINQTSDAQRIVTQYVFITVKNTPDF